MKFARALLIVVAVLLAAPPSEGVAAGFSAETEHAQRLLQSLGYDPGPVDGLVGQRVRAAVRAFQQDRDLPQTGRIDAGLLAALERAARPPERAVAREPLSLPPVIAPPAPVPPPAPPLQGQTWRIVDADNQAETVLTFAADGRVLGPAFADDMRWSQPAPTRVRLVFETPLGGRVVRTGELLTADTMQGEGESDRRVGPDRAKSRWSWLAERVQEP